MTEYQEAVCDLMAENGNLRAEIERLRKAIEYACHSLDLGRITSTVASELRAAVGQKAHMVGEYVADYTMPTPEELAQPDGTEELFAKSKPLPRDK